MRLRVKLAQTDNNNNNASFVLAMEGGEGDVTLRALMEAIASRAMTTSTTTTAKRLLVGFPPKPVEMDETNAEMALSTFGIHDADVITVEMTSSSQQQPPSQPTSQRKKRAKNREETLVVPEGFAAIADPAGSFLQGNEEVGVEFMRAASQLALKRHYELVLGEKRYEAALAGRVEMTADDGGAARRLGDGAVMTTRTRVVFKVGPRATHTETVDIPGEEVVRGALMTVVGDEKTRYSIFPPDMAKVSPKIFWALYKMAREGNYDSDASVNKSEDMMMVCLRKRILPDVDLSFLASRHREPSEKAKMNASTSSSSSPARNSSTTKKARSGGALDKSETGKDAEDDDDLAACFDSIEVRKRLRALGMKRLDVLVERNPEASTETPDLVALIGEARRYVAMRRMMPSILRGALPETLTVEETLARLKDLDVIFPNDVSRLRIPGRTEMVVKELGEGIGETEHVGEWRRRADHLLTQHSWLVEYRSARG